MLLTLLFQIKKKWWKLITPQEDIAWVDSVKTPILSLCVTPTQKEINRIISTASDYNGNHSSKKCIYVHIYIISAVLEK